MIRRRRLPLLVVTAVAIPLALWVGPALVWRSLPLDGEPPSDGLARVAGALHVHTTLSDGTGAPEYVVQAGREAGLSFLVITDHNTNGAARSLDGYRDGMLVLVGAELSTHQGHLLGLGMRPSRFPFAPDASGALDDVRYLGGVAFAAHPTSRRDALAWSGWELAGPWGLEVLNMDSLWRRASWPTLLGGLVTYPFNSIYALANGLDRPRAALARWDTLLGRRDVAGLAGVDAHGSLFGQHEYLPELPSYGSLFRVLRTYVVLNAPLTGEPARDVRAVRDALARGRSYMAMDALAPADGFFFDAARGNETWRMGDTVPPAPDLLLRAGGRLPRGARIELYRDGQRIADGRGTLEFPASVPGTYRIEVGVAGWDIPWVLSNPIYVYGAAEAAARARRAAWPVEPPSPAVARTLDAFETGSALAAESDAGTWVDPEVRVPSTRAPGAAAARLHFRFAEPRPDRSAIWGALVDRSRRDLSRDSGLVFDIRADGVYRVWVGLWEERPGQVGDEPDWWLSSVRTSTAWRRQAIPFQRLHPAGNNVDRKLDLRRVVGLVFHIDPGTDEFAAEGKVWFDRLGAY